MFYRLGILIKEQNKTKHNPGYLVIYMVRYHPLVSVYFFVLYHSKRDFHYRIRFLHCSANWIFTIKHVLFTLTVNDITLTKHVNLNLINFMSFSSLKHAGNNLKFCCASNLSSIKEQPFWLK